MEQRPLREDCNLLSKRHEVWPGRWQWDKERWALGRF